MEQSSPENAARSSSSGLDKSVCTPENDKARDAQRDKHGNKIPLSRLSSENRTVT